MQLGTKLKRTLEENAFYRGSFLKRVVTKSRGSSTTIENSEVMLLIETLEEMVEHVKLKSHRVLAHK